MWTHKQIIAAGSLPLIAAGLLTGCTTAKTTTTARAATEMIGSRCASFPGIAPMCRNSKSPARKHKNIKPGSRNLAGQICGTPIGRPGRNHTLRG